MVRWKSFPKPLAGDWLVLVVAALVVAVLFATLWHPEHAARLTIRAGDTVYGSYSLQQRREVEVPGPLGISRVLIEQGRVRFLSSPCHNQYCVHQGWLQRAGQVAVCLPNRVSVELQGGDKGYDSLNY